MPATSTNQSFIEALALCHSLRGSKDQIEGYPLDKATFEATKYVLDSGIKNMNNRSCKGVIESPNRAKTFAIRKIFRFDASLQKSSVIVEDLDGGNQMAFTKGSPGSIFDICDLSSVPQSYFDTVRTYTSQGFYCIAYASKSIKLKEVGQVCREDVEVGLTFLGFALFQVY